MDKMTADQTDDVRDVLAKLPPTVIGGLLACLPKLCPRCGMLMIVRTSKRTTTGDRLAHLRCRACGKNVKRTL